MPKTIWLPCRTCLKDKDGKPTGFIPAPNGSGSNTQTCPECQGNKYVGLVVPGDEPTPTPPVVNPTHRDWYSLLVMILMAVSAVSGAISAYYSNQANTKVDTVEKRQQENTRSIKETENNSAAVRSIIVGDLPESKE